MKSFKVEIQRSRGTRTRDVHVTAVADDGQEVVLYAGLPFEGVSLEQLASTIGALVLTHVQADWSGFGVREVNPQVAFDVQWGRDPWWQLGCR